MQKFKRINATNMMNIKCLLHKISSKKFPVLAVHWNFKTSRGYIYNLLFSEIIPLVPHHMQLNAILLAVGFWLEIQAVGLELLPRLHVSMMCFTCHS